MWSHSKAHSLGYLVLDTPLKLHREAYSVVVTLSLLSLRRASIGQTHRAQIPVIQVCASATFITQIICYMYL